MRKMKKVLCLALVIVMFLTGCGLRTLTCDGCGKAITVREKSNVTEDWIVFCSTCEKELLKDLEGET